MDLGGAHTSSTMKIFYVIKTSTQVRSFFGHFLKSAKNSAADFFLAVDIFNRPLLCFAAEISASWQHCSIKQLPVPCHGWNF
jgi:hypothetical protein